MVSDLDNLYNDVSFAIIYQKKNFSLLFHHFGRRNEYLELPKGDMNTPTLIFLLRPYTIIILTEKNYTKK